MSYDNLKDLDEDVRLKLDPISVLNEKLNKILEQQEFIIRHLEIPECVDVKYICQKLEISKTKVYSSPWLLPNFSKSDYANGRKRWKRKTWEDWRAIDEKTREVEWLKLPLKTREQISNVVEAG